MSQEETTTNINEKDNQAETPSAAAETVRDSAQNEELTKARQQAQEYLEGWQRERAEFTNYRKRVDNQLKDSYQNAALDVLKKFLPIIDDFERAMATAPAELADQAWLNGVMLIHRKFQKILEEAGVEAIDPVGQPFDPTRHEAVSVEDSADGNSGQVIATLQKGYAYGDRVLRPAMVRVAR
ncbi:MAG: nucleotide exchange factor GrpE [Chloroflexi bacterium]|nr:nucleotide exchange factor GrpE [Chloroflexota bacterium]